MVLLAAVAVGAAAATSSTSTGIATCALGGAAVGGVVAFGRWVVHRLCGETESKEAPNSASAAESVSSAPHVPAPAKPSSDSSNTEYVVTADSIRAEIAKNNIVFGAYLGSGGFGAVFRFTLPGLGGHAIAGKLVKLSRMDAELVRREFSNAARVNHPNVVAVYDIKVHPDMIVIFMEELASFDPTRHSFPRVMKDAARGLQAIHDQHMVHSDIKMDNIMVDKDGNGKITDFGVSAHLQKLSRSAYANSARMLGGTPHFYAPECKKRFKCSAKSDVFALALTFLMVTLSAPVRNRWIRAGRKPAELPADVPRWVRLSLDHEPSVRPTAQQLVDMME